MREPKIQLGIIWNVVTQILKDKNEKTIDDWFLLQKFLNINKTTIDDWFLL